MQMVFFDKNVSIVLLFYKCPTILKLPNYRGIARLTLMVGHTFYNTTYLLLYLMACWFIREFIYGCFKSEKYE